MSGRQLTLDEAEWPEVRAAMRIAHGVLCATGDRVMADHYDSLSIRLDDRWGTSPTGDQAGASALRALDVLIGGFENDNEARLWLTDLIRMVSVTGVQTATSIERWSLRMVEQRAARP
jgi:hypothetical protein